MDSTSLIHIFPSPITERKMLNSHSRRANIHIWIRLLLPPKIGFPLEAILLTSKTHFYFGYLYRYSVGGSLQRESTEKSISWWIEKNKITTRSVGTQQSKGQKLHLQQEITTRHNSKLATSYVLIKAITLSCLGRPTVVVWRFSCFCPSRFHTRTGKDSRTLSCR